MQVSIDFYLANIAKPVESGSYLTIKTLEGGMRYVEGEVFSAKWGLFGCYDAIDYNDEEIEKIMKFQPLFWAELPDIVRQKEGTNDKKRINR